MSAARPRVSWLMRSEREFRDDRLELSRHPAQLVRRLLSVVGALGGVLRRYCHIANVLGDVADPLGSFGHTAADLIGGHRLFFHRRGNAVGDVVDLINDRTDLLDRLDGALSVALDGIDLLADILGCLGSLLGEFFYLVGYHSEALACFAGACGLNGGI